MNKKEIAKTAEKTMALKEIAEITGASYRTVASYARKAGWTKDGKRTLLNVEQTTIIIEAMKQSIGQGGKRALAGKQRLALAMQGINTGKSRALQIDLLHRQIEAEMQSEIDELNTQNQTLRTNLQATQQLWANEPRGWK